jgi:hypothetical protein
MFIDFVLGLMSNIISALADVLPTFSVWPVIVTNGITDVCTAFMKLNWIFPMDALLDALSFFIDFLGWYFFAKLIIMIFNYFRGADGIRI